MRTSGALGTGLHAPADQRASRLIDELADRNTPANNAGPWPSSYTASAEIGRVYVLPTGDHADPSQRMMPRRSTSSDRDIPPMMNSRGPAPSSKTVSTPPAFVPWASGDHVCPFHFAT